MILRKWDYDTDQYMDFEIANNLNIQFDFNNNKEVNCPHCGRIVSVHDEAYSSMEIHDSIGIGYIVCGSCYKEELARRIKYKGNK